MNEPKILFFDIETSPILGYTFGLYEQNVIHVERESIILAFAYKWLGETKIYCHALPDYKGYEKNPFDDSALVKDLHAILESADIVVAHNGDGFDIKVSNVRFIQNNLPPVLSKISIDTLKEVRKKFKFSSNKLTDLAGFAGLGSKIETGGKGLWIGCMNKDMKSWKLMKKYNIHDVKLLEGIYLWIRPWIKTHPNVNLIKGTVFNCPRCSSPELNKRGFHHNYNGKFQVYTCKQCLYNSISKTNLLKNKPIVK